MTVWNAQLQIDLHETSIHINLQAGLQNTEPFEDTTLPVVMQN